MSYPLLNSLHTTISGAHAANVITCVPTGNIVSTTVQGAINELGTRNRAGSSIDGGPATTADKLSASRSINGVGFDGSGDIAISTIYDTSFKRITCPGGAVLTNYTPTTGAVCIRLPKGYSNTNLRFKVRIFSFVSGGSFDATIAGYPWSGSSWLVPSAYISGSPTENLEYPIRFGYDSTSGKAEVYIGDISQVWAESNIYVTEVQCGFGSLDQGWLSGWQIFFESTAYRNVTATVNGCQIGYRPANVFTGTKTINGVNYNYVNGLLLST